MVKFLTKSRTHELHLKSESHNVKRELLQMKLQNKSRIQLLREYNTDNIEKILVRLEQSHFIGYEFEKKRRSLLPPVYKLTDEEIANQNEEKEFKEQFMNFLGKQHNNLRGAAVTGDDAFDDILYILMYCFLQGKNFDEGKYDFNNFERSKMVSKKRFTDFTLFLRINKLLEDTLCIRPKTGKCALEKIGTILKKSSYHIRINR